MYVDSSTVKRGNKTYTRHLLRSSFREGKKVKHRTVANLSSCSQQEIDAIKLALKHKNKLHELAALDEVKTELGKRFGAVWVSKVLADRTGITKALGGSPDGAKALLQVIARLIDQGSRLSAVRFAMRHAVCECLHVDKLNEDDLYRNLAWLADEQERIEMELFQRRYGDAVPKLFLYDVTSSYLEGENNALARWGYNRDKKAGKKQIVVGLLTGPDGMPAAVRVFDGNTNDTKTVAEQIQILTNKFGVTKITLVGDRGMLKGPQIEALPEGFQFITAITKSQIKKMLDDGLFQYELFSERVCEVLDNGLRYILRRNPVRAREMADSRASKRKSIEAIASKETTYLAEHPRADAGKAVTRIEKRIERLKASRWLSVVLDERTLKIVSNGDALVECSRLDGCYVVKSDVPQEEASAQNLHDRYCELEFVERAFRTLKTTHLELRPIYVRKAESTRGHVLVVMLALLLQRELESCWREFDITVEEGLDELAAIATQKVRLRDAAVDNIPQPNEFATRLLASAQVTLPFALPHRTARVSTKKKLQSERI